MKIDVLRHVNYQMLLSAAGAARYLRYENAFLLYQDPCSYYAYILVGARQQKDQMKTQVFSLQKAGALASCRMKCLESPQIKWTLAASHEVHWSSLDQCYYCCCCCCNSSLATATTADLQMMPDSSSTT